MISQSEAAVFVVYGVALAFFGTLVFKQIAQLYKTAVFEYDYMKHPRLVEHSILRACSEEPHKWVDAALALRGLTSGTYKVCGVCGTILGNQVVMCSDEVLKQIKQALDLNEKRQAAELLIHARITELANGYIDHYIKRNFAEEINDVHYAEKLRALAKFSVKSLADASEKVAAELIAQNDLESRYDGWTSKVKGHA